MKKNHSDKTTSDMKRKEREQSQGDFFVIFMNTTALRAADSLRITLFLFARHCSVAASGVPVKQAASFLSVTFK